MLTEQELNFINLVARDEQTRTKMISDKLKLKKEQNRDKKLDRMDKNIEKKRRYLAMKRI